MVDKVDRLTTTYNMDGNLESKAAAAAKAVITLKQAQAELGGETQKTEQRITQSASAAERLVGKYVAGYTATQQLVRDTEKLNALREREPALAAQIDRALEGIAAKQRQLAQTYQQTGAAIDAQAVALQRLKAVQDQVNAVTGVSGRSDSANRAADVAAYGAELDRLRAKFSPLYAAQSQYLVTLKEIRDAERLGAISATEAGAAIVRLKQSFADNVTALKGAPPALAATTTGLAATAAAAKLTHTETQILRSGLVNTIQTLASGGSALQTFQTQLFQTAPAFPALVRNMGPALLGVGALAIGLTALGGVMVAGALRARDLASESRAFGVVLASMGDRAATSTGQLNKLVESMRDLGVSKDDARASVTSLLRNPNLSSAGVQRVAALTPDFAAGSGQDAQTAAKALADAMAGGYDAVMKLADSYRLLTPAQKDVIRGLYETGKAGEGANVFLGAVEQRFGASARNSMSDFAKALNDIQRAWTGMTDRIANSKPMLDALANFANNMKLFNQLTGGSDPDPIGTLQAREKKLSKYKPVFTGFLGKILENPEYDAKQLAEIRGKLAQAALDNITVPPGARGPGGVPYSTNGDSPIVTPSVSTALQNAQADQALRRRMIGASGAGRAAIEAELATNQAMRGPDGIKDDRKAVLLLEQEKAYQGLNDAIAKSANLAKIEADATLSVAAAFAKSEAAGQEALIQRQAAIDSFDQYNTAADRARIATQLRNKAINDSIVSGAQAIASMGNQRDAAFALLEAEKQGAGAVAEATIQNRINAETLDQRLKLVGADAAQTTELNRIIAEKTGLIREQSEIERQIYLTQQDRAANDQIEIATMQRQISLITDVNERRRTEIALARQQQEIALRNDPRYANDPAARAALLTKGDQIRALQDQTRFYDEIRQQAQGLANDVSQFLVDGFVNANKGGKSAFQNLWDGALAGAKRFVAQLAAQFLQQKILLPIAMQIVGGAPGAFGIANPGGASSGGFSLGGVGDIASVGKMIPGVGNWINGAVDSFGAWTGLGASTGILTGATAGAASAAGVGTAGAAIAAETGISAFGTAGGALTGAAGLSAALPYVGAGIMAVSLLTSFLGGKKSVGPGGGIGFGAGADGKINIGFTAQDNGYDPVAKNSDAAQAVVDGALKFFKQIGGTYKGTGVTDRAAELGYDAGLKKYVGGDDTSNGKGRFDTIEQAMAASLIAIVKNSIVDGVSKDIQDRIKAVSTAQDMENLLQYIAGLNQVYDAFKGWRPPLTAAEQAMQQLNAAFDQAKSAAESLSKSTDDLKASFEKQKAYLIDQFNAPLKERELRATGQNQAADLFAFDRQAADTRTQAAALGAEAVLQAERTLSLERAAIVKKYADQELANVQAQRDAIVAANAAQAQAQAQAFGAIMDSIASGLNETLAAWRGVASNLMAFKNSLGLSTLSVLSPTEQLNLARSQYSDLVSKALGGDVTAAQGVQGAAQTLLEKGQAYYASGAGYGDLYSQVNSDVGGLINWANGGAQVQANQRAADMIKSIRASMGVPGFAEGGFHQGGWAVVGERGPELRYMGASQVLSFEDSSRLFRQSIATANDNSANAEIRALREEIALLRREASVNAAQTAGAIVEAVLTNTDATRRMAYAQERMAAAPTNGVRAA